MRDQRWKGDYETVPQEFRAARMEESMGMKGVNASYGNDYMGSNYDPPFDAYQMGELEKSWSNQLDKIGMQPHAREYLEENIVTGKQIGRAHV